ncbi:MAG: hypothetical protein IAG13_18325, partial [Deltaproteobacteria bacterium]|nr:hypothetical protein [Nannocystaceae bacterium]
MDAAVALERCLEPDELLALVDGGCDDDSRRAALSHAATCEACRLAIAGVARAVRSDLGGGSGGAVLPAAEPMPEHIGRHRIVRMLGRGG